MHIVLIQCYYSFDFIGKSLAVKKLHASVGVILGRDTLTIGIRYVICGTKYLKSVQCWCSHRNHSTILKIIFLFVVWGVWLHQWITLIYYSSFYTWCNGRIAITSDDVRMMWSMFYIMSQLRKPSLYFIFQLQ